MLLRPLSASLVLMLGLALVGTAGTKGKDDNPYRSAKVGDYTVHKTTTKIGGLAVEGTMKQLITSKDEKQANIKATVSVLGQEINAPAAPVDLTKPFDPASVVNQGAKGKAEFKQYEKDKGEGKEKIKAAGKEYDCTWIAGKVVTEQMGIKVEGDVKVWFSKQAPLSGMVRMEMKAEIMGTPTETIVELSKFGNASSDKE